MRPKGRRGVSCAFLHERPTLLNATNIEGETALHVAAANGHSQVIKVLIKKGANLNQVDKYERLTALQRAAMNGHEIAGYLFKHGADVTITETSWEERHSTTAQRGASRPWSGLSSSSYLKYATYPTTTETRPLHWLVSPSTQRPRRCCWTRGVTRTTGTPVARRAGMTSAVSSNRRSCKALLEEWDRVYSLIKARRTYDASDTLVTLGIHCFDDPPKETDDALQVPAWLEDRTSGVPGLPLADGLPVVAFNTQVHGKKVPEGVAAAMSYVVKGMGYEVFKELADLMWPVKL